MKTVLTAFVVVVGFAALVGATIVPIMAADLNKSHVSDKQVNGTNSYTLMKKGIALTVKMRYH